MEMVMNSKYSQLLFALLCFSSVCYGQSASRFPDGFEIYTPTKKEDILNSTLQNIIKKEGDQWELNLAEGKSNGAIEVILFMDKTQPLDFVLKAVDMYAITSPNQISLDVADVSKKFDFVWMNTVNSVYLNIMANGIDQNIGMLTRPTTTIPKFTIDYEGKVSATSDAIVNPKVPTQQALLSSGQSSANHTVLISWENLQTAFTISFPSSIFRAIRPVSPPSTTTTLVETTTSKSSLASVSTSDSSLVASSNVGYIIGGVLGGLVLLIALVALIVYCYCKKSKKKKYPIAKPAVASIEDPNQEAPISVVLNEGIFVNDGIRLQRSQTLQSTQVQSEAPTDVLPKTESAAKISQPKKKHSAERDQPKKTRSAERPPPKMKISAERHQPSKQKNDTYLKSSEKPHKPVVNAAPGEYEPIANLQQPLPPPPPAPEKQYDAIAKGQKLEGYATLAIHDPSNPPPPPPQ